MNISSGYSIYNLSFKPHVIMMSCYENNTGFCGLSIRGTNKILLAVGGGYNGLTYDVIWGDNYVALSSDPRRENMYICAMGY